MLIQYEPYLWSSTEDAYVSQYADSSGFSVGPVDANHQKACPSVNRLSRINISEKDRSAEVEHTGAYLLLCVYSSE